ncbi:hypothetical protein QCA50_002539 [Cerrena zonata]|uniref:FAD-binding domain-containing protein n=1 Tax=Cerrena zonata TaxID=2478898 RepID=A0AAW0GRT4_9APHY
MSNKSLEVVIIGAGIVGLTCALALEKEGINVKIYEASSEYKEIGAGLGMGPTALRILHGLGVSGDVIPPVEQLHRQENFLQFRSSKEGHELIYDSYKSKAVDERAGLYGVGRHRALVLAALAKCIKPRVTHFGKRCSAIEASPYGGRTVVHFTDNTSVEADVVIGADGIKSTVRQAVLPEDDKSDHIGFSGTVAYRGLVPTPVARAAGVNSDFPMGMNCFIGKDKHIIVNQIQGGKLINVAAFITDPSNSFSKPYHPDENAWVVPATTEEIERDFSDSSNELVTLLKCIREPTKWSICAVHPALPSFAKGRVAVIGDAAHAMLPHLALGASQGIEDAHLLAKLLGDPRVSAEHIL